MRIIQYFLICFLSLSLTANAQHKKAENSLLWEISGKDLTKPSYLFGTYHFAGKDFVDTMKVLNMKLNSADAIVGEMVMKKNMIMKLTPYMTLKNNSLDKLLTPEEYKLVKDFLKTAGYDISMFNTMKPAVVQTIVEQLYAPKTFNEKNPALDQYFQDYGKQNGKKTIGLETIEEQADLLFGTSIEKQKDALLKNIKDNIKDSEKNKKEAQQLYDNYIAQDLGKLEKLFSESDDITPAEMDRMLKNRNLKWLDKLPGLMQAQSLFIAVGAGHLLGKDGLIKGLQAQGYTVKPLITN